LEASLSEAVAVQQEEARGHRSEVRRVEDNVVRPLKEEVRGTQKEERRRRRSLSYKGALIKAPFIFIVDLLFFCEFKAIFSTNFSRSTHTFWWRRPVTFITCFPHLTGIQVDRWRSQAESLKVSLKEAETRNKEQEREHRREQAHIKEEVDKRQWRC
jgi:hypothetical protein